MTGELVEEIPPHHEIAEITQVPQLKTKLGCAISRDSGARTQPQQTRKGFQLLVSAKRKGISTFQVASVQPQRATLAPPQLQWLIYSINHTPLMAAQVKGRVNY